MRLKDALFLVQFEGNPIDPQLRARRKEMLIQISRGISIMDTSRALSEKYGRTPESIKNDWGRRKKWIPEIVKIDDPTIFHQLIAGLRSLITTYGAVYGRAVEAHNTNAQVGALRSMETVYVNLIQILQSVGIIKKVPIQIEAVEGLPQIDWEELSEEDKAVLTQSARILIEARSKKQPESVY